MAGEIDEVALEHRLTSLEGAVQGVGKRMDSRLGKIEGHLDTLNNRTGKLEGRVSELEHREMKSSSYDEGYAAGQNVLSWRDIAKIAGAVVAAMSTLLGAGISLLVAWLEYAG